MHEYPFPKPLNEVETKKYFNKLLNGDREAKAILIEHNLRLVAFISKGFIESFEHEPAISLEDIISIGNFGLISAVDNYDISKNIKFATYASKCIQNEILMYLRKTEKFRNNFSLQQNIWLNDEKEITAENIISSNENLEETYIANEIIFELDLAIKQLPNNLRRIYKLHIIHEKSQTDIAKELGCSQSLISRKIRRSQKLIEDYRNNIKASKMKRINNERSVKMKQEKTIYDVLNKYTKYEIDNGLKELEKDQREMLLMRFPQIGGGSKLSEICLKFGIKRGSINYQINKTLENLENIILKNKELQKLDEFKDPVNKKGKRLQNFFDKVNAYNEFIVREHRKPKGPINTKAEPTDKYTEQQLCNFYQLHKGVIPKSSYKECIELTKNLDGLIIENNKTKSENGNRRKKQTIYEVYPGIGRPEVNSALFQLSEANRMLLLDYYPITNQRFLTLNEISAKYGMCIPKINDHVKEIKEELDKLLGFDLELPEKFILEIQDRMAKERYDFTKEDIMSNYDNLKDKHKYPLACTYKLDNKPYYTVIELSKRQKITKGKVSARIEYGIKVICANLKKQLDDGTLPSLIKTGEVDETIQNDEEVKSNNIVDNLPTDNENIGNVEKIAQEDISLVNEITDVKSLSTQIVEMIVEKISGTHVEKVILSSYFLQIPFEKISEYLEISVTEVNEILHSKLKLFKMVADNINVEINGLETRRKEETKKLK